MKSTKVTDPNILKLLNAPDESTKVTDINLLNQLNAQEEPQESETFLQKLPRNIAIGGAQFGTNFLNTPYHLIHALENRAEKLGKKRFGLSQYIPHTQDVNPALFGQTEEPTFSDKLIQGLMQFAPGMLLPGTSIGKGAATLQQIPKIGGLLSEAAPHMISQGAFGVTQNENPIKGFEEGALGALGGTAIGKGIEKTINTLKPANLFKTPLSKKELVKNYQITQGMPSDIGNIIENPFWQRAYENKLPKFSNEPSSIMQETGKQIVNKGNAILSDLLGPHESNNVPTKINEILTKEFEKHQTFKNKFYDSVNETAEKENFKSDLTNFTNKAKEYMDAIQDTTLLKHEPDARKILNKLLHYSEPIDKTETKGLLVDTSGKPLLHNIEEKSPTLKELNILKGKLNEYAKTYGSSPNPADRNMAKIFNQLAVSLKGDIKNSIEATGNEILKKGYNAAEENYAKNFSKFLDKDIYKFAKGIADPETIITKFLTTSTTSDLAAKLAKLAQHLDQTQSTKGQQNRNLLAYGYLSRALDNEGNLNPAKLTTLIKKLGPNQFKVLVPNKALRKELMNYKTLTQKNKESLNVMFNPHTGQRNSDLIALLGSGGLGSSIGAALAGTPGSIAGGIIGPYLASKTAKYTAGKLTNEETRRNLIKALVANKPTKLPKTIEALAKTGAYLNQ